jgi:hypothetical protein
MLEKLEEEVILMKEALEFSKTFRDKFFERKLFSESQWEEVKLPN